MNYSRDSQQFTEALDSGFLSTKTKLYNLVGTICNNLGIKSLGTYFLDKARDVHNQEMNEKKPRVTIRVLQDS